MKIMVGRAMGNSNPDRLTENGGSRIGILERLVRGSSVVSSLDEHTTRSHFPLRIVDRIVHHRFRKEIREKTPSSTKLGFSQGAEAFFTSSCDTNSPDVRVFNFKFSFLFLFFSVIRFFKDLGVIGSGKISREKKGTKNLNIQSKICICVAMSYYFR